MTALRALAVVAGVAVVVATTTSVLRNLVVPRRLRSRLRILVGRGVAAPFRAVAGRTAAYERRDAVMAWSAG